MTRTRSWLLAGAIIPAFVLPQAGFAQPQAAPAGTVEFAQAPAPGDDQPGRGPRGGRGGADAESPDQPRRERAPGVPRAPDAPRGPAAERPAPPAAPGAERPAAPRAPAGAAPQPDRTPPMPRPVPSIVAPETPGQPAARPTPVPSPNAPPAVRPTPPRPPGADVDQPRRAAPPAAAPAVPAPPAAAPAPAPRAAPGATPGTAPLNAPAPQTAPAPAQRTAPGATPGTAPLNAPAPQTAPVPPAGRAPGATPPAATPPAPGQTLAPPPAGQPPQAAPGQIAPGQAAPGQAAPGQVSPGQVAPGQPPAPDQRQGRRGGIGLGGAAAIGLGAGVVGGIMATQGANRLDDVRSRREERREGDVTIIREPGRTIIRDDDRVIIRRDETQRFRELGIDQRVERRGEETRTVFERPDGTRVVTITDDEGRLIRRTRQTRGDEEFVIIDNTRRDRPDRRFSDEIVVLERPALRIPRERYIVDAESADRELIYETITAPPLSPLPRRYTLDEVRYSPDLRAQMRSVDIDSITFETASWEVSRSQAGRLQVIAESLRRALQASPNEVFLVEGHTDAVGPDIDNLSLSDRRAQSVAEILTRDFQVPPENLTTQGYGEQYLKVNTQSESRENRRVTLRRITPLLAGQNAPQ